MTAALKISLIAGVVVFAAGCGGNGGPAPTSGQAVAITAQPLSQTVPIGQTATFTVTATGTTPIGYQWSKNGAAIPGAIGASYTTPIAQLGPDNSTAIGSFQVTVSNTVNSVTSKIATLTAGPRGPQAGDLRYLLNQQVDLPGFTTTAGLGFGWLGITEESIANAVGTPLTLGSTWYSTSGCLWEFNYWYLPSPMTGLGMYYQEDFTNQQSYTSYLQSVAQPNTVITSMDLEPACQIFGVSWALTAEGGGFDQRIETIPIGASLAPAIQNQATLDGSASRIITAATFDDAGQQAVLLSYGWKGDATTVYESQTYLVPPSQIGSAAATLANAGYFISAFGGNDTDGYILVGMRVKGDSLPRPIWGSGVGTAPETITGPYPTLVIWDNEPSQLSQDWQIWEQ
jgi:hypothetical protein